MNYGLTAAAVLGVLALSAPKEPQHNLMKLPSFKGILEVRASIPGRMRLYVPSLSGSMDQAEQAREQLLGTGVVHRVELEPRTGSMLVCYDERKVEAAVIEGAVIKLLGLDAVINGKQKSRMESGLHTILDAVDRGVMGATNGLMDGKMLAGTALSVLAIKEWRLAGLAVPGAMTLLWWAARLFGGGSPVNIVGETFLRHCLKPRVECDLPGRLRMRFRHSEQLSKEALPYLHYVQDVLTMLPGVTDVTVNARIGTVLVLYDAQTTSSRRILRWVDIVVDTGLEIAKEIKPEEVNEQKLEQIVRQRLILRLPQVKEG